MEKMKRSLSGFTLIELLIVVAIIAILAAIAVPNFLEAQTRAKVSRAKADMRTLDTGISTYQMDWNAYLRCNRPAFGIQIPAGTPARNNHMQCFERLTSPVSYLASAASYLDPFKPKGSYDATWNAKMAPWTGDDIKRASVYNYYARNTSAGGQARWDELKNGTDTVKPNWWFAVSAGPEGWTFHGDYLNNATLTKGELAVAMYDATNGTVSKGNIWRANGGPASTTDRNFFELIQGQY